jgi:hypothetical protein
MVGLFSFERCTGGNVCFGNRNGQNRVFCSSTVEKESPLGARLCFESISNRIFGTPPGEVASWLADREWTFLSIEQEAYFGRYSDFYLRKGGYAISRTKPLRIKREEIEAAGCPEPVFLTNGGEMQA